MIRFIAGCIVAASAAALVLAALGYVFLVCRDLILDRRRERREKALDDYRRAMPDELGRPR